MFHRQELSHLEHVRAGRQSGIAWKTAIPVSDPHSLQAQQRESRGGASGGGADFSGGIQNGFRPPRPPQGFTGFGGQGIGYGGGRFRSPSASRQAHVRDYR
ncbi:MAG: hypothetical protein IT342_04790 [Candidatus Melainabacteria bacterium]|nr:hypothetical protein [Candidatus Melainabacteria bacterium]